MLHKDEPIPHIKTWCRCNAGAGTWRLVDPYCSQVDGLAQPGSARISEICLKKQGESLVWWHMPLLLECGRQRQTDVCELEARLVCRLAEYT